MIAGLARQVRHPLAVLQDQDAIAAQPTNDRPRWRRAEAPRRDARLVLQRFAHGCFQLFLQLLPGQDRRRLERLELAARIGRNRYHFLEVQLRIDPDIEGGGRPGHRHFNPPIRVTLRADR